MGARLAMVAVGALLIGGIFYFGRDSAEPGDDVASADNAPVTGGGDAPTSTTTTTEPPPSSTTAGPCRAGIERTSAEGALFNLVDAYNRHDAIAVDSLLGTGPVVDPYLDPEGAHEYASAEDWVTTAATVGDVLEVVGIGGQPLTIIAHRHNEVFAAVGIEDVALRLAIELDASCAPRITATNPISTPDPCAFSEAFATKPIAGCGDPFEPRQGHIAIWTGADLVVHGGASGTIAVPGLTSGLAFEPGSDSWRDIAASPTSLSGWPGPRAVWTGEHVLFVAATADADGNHRIGVFSYDPDRDSWSELATMPDDAVIGAVAWTGDELIMAGGASNLPDDRTWAYRPSTDTWRELFGADLEPVEGMAGVWTGEEAVFIGGYSGHGGREGVAYDPATNTWRDLAPSPDGQSVEGHELFWTGSEVLVVGGHSGPAHRGSLAIYDPVADSWRASEPLPIAAGEHLGADWTGTELIIWGGFGTYGGADGDRDHVYGEGAAYDPATDRWRVLAPSPLTDRCHHSGTWTGTEFIVFGGLEICGDPGILGVGTAAAYDPATDTWRELG